MLTVELGYAGGERRRRASGGRRTDRLARWLVTIGTLNCCHAVPFVGFVEHASVPIAFPELAIEELAIERWPGAEGIRSRPVGGGVMSAGCSRPESPPPADPWGR